MAQQSDSPQASLMDQHTDAGVDYCQHGRSDQPNLDTHHVAHDEQERPSKRGGDEGEPPPVPENQAAAQTHGQPRQRGTDSVM